MFVKYANVVEVTRNAKINIQHRGSNNCVYYKGEKDGKKIFQILSATPNVKGIEKFVGIIHELAHVLFESPFNGINRLLLSWNIDAGGEEYQLYFNAFNVLEDQRIESQMGKMYLKHKSRFDKTTKKLGLLMKDETLLEDNPVNMLLAIRFQRGDDIKNLENYDVYKKALDDVVLTDKYGALRILVMLKPYIEKWIKNKNQRNEQREENTKDYDPDEEIMDSRDKARTRRIFKENNAETMDDDGVIPDDLYDSDLSDEYKEEMIKESKDEGKNVVDNIFQELRNDVDSTNLPKNVKIIERYKSVVEIDMKVSRGLSKLFKSIKMRYGDFTDYEGEEIDIDAYIEGIIRGNNINKCRINQNITQGTSIVISIDGSMSMEGQRIRVARNLVATLYESVKEIDNVEIRANVWSGNTMGWIGITEINKQEDCDMIDVRSTSRGFFSTPTHMALEYSARMLKQMRGSKKMMILITDGQPNHFNGGYRVSTPTYVKTCKKSLAKAFSVTRNIMCIVVQDDTSFRHNPIRQLFTPMKLMNVYKMTDASEKVIKRFKRMVMKNIV